VADLARQLDLPLEARDHAGIGRYLGQQRLQRYALVQLRVLGLIDLAHAAAAQWTQDAVAAGSYFAGLEGRGALRGRRVQKPSRAMLLQHLSYFAEELFVAAAGGTEVVLHLGGGSVQSRIEDVASPVPVLRTHRRNSRGGVDI
jgi:hypothetical protein